MKILKIVSSRDDGGVFTSERAIIKVLKERQVTVDLIIIGNGERLNTYQEIADTSIVLPDFHAKLSGSLLRIASEVLRMKSYGRKHSKNLPNALNGGYQAIIYRRPIFIFLAGMIGRAFRTKSFWHMPNIVRSASSRFFYTSFLTKYGIIPIANSNYTRASLPICRHVIYPGFSQDRVRVTFDNFRAELKIPIGAPVFGMAGRICVDKAQDTLIKSFVASDAISRGAHLVLAGGFENDSFRRELLGLAGDYLNKQIHFLGKINDLPKFYSTIDVALNSRRNAEPFGISIAEGLAAGKPVIAYYLGGPSEMIENKSSGWLVKAPDVNSWTKAFNISLAARPYWKVMGEKAKEGVGKFSVETNVSKLLTIIEK